MIKFIKDYWFECLLGLCLVLFLLFSIVVGIAPHNDAKGRGFTKCTSEMAFVLQQEEKLSIIKVAKMVSKGYGCYALVMAEGIKLFIQHKQPTPWNNYLFEEESLEYQEDEGEGFSEDLLKANLLDDTENDSKKLWDMQKKENDDEK